MKTTVIVIISLSCYYLFSAMVGAMLPPLPGQERTTYGFWFRALNQIAANAHRLVENQLHINACAVPEHSWKRFRVLTAVLLVAFAMAIPLIATGHPIWASLVFALLVLADVIVALDNLWP